MARRSLMAGVAAASREYERAGLALPNDVTRAYGSVDATASLLLEARDMLAPGTLLPHGLAAALTRFADAHTHLADVLPTRPPG